MIENEKFEMTARQGVIVYLYRLRQSRQLRKFGQIEYVSKRMKYLVLYMNQDQIKQNIAKIKKMRNVRKVQLSYRPFLRTDYASSEDGYKLTEEDKEKFKKTSCVCSYSNSPKTRLAYMVFQVCGLDTTTRILGKYIELKTKKNINKKRVDN